MPYSVKNPSKGLVKRIKKRHPKAAMNEIKQFIHVFNGAIEDGDSEEKAFAKAWGVLNKNPKLKSSHRKTDPKKTKKEVKKQEKKSSLSKAKMLIDLANSLDRAKLCKEAGHIETLVKNLINNDH